MPNRPNCIVITKRCVGCGKLFFIPYSNIGWSYRILSSQLKNAKLPYNDHKEGKDKTKWTYYCSYGCFRKAQVTLEEIEAEEEKEQMRAERKKKR